jgi:hypothetical protein
MSNTQIHFGEPASALKRFLLFSIFSVLLVSMFSCGSTLGFVEPADLCKCLPLGPAIADYRHAAKHVPIPSIPAIEIGVDTILAWKQDAALPIDTPRSGRELQVYHVAQAFLQNASVNSEDCDIHLEISRTADKNAPRVVVETPVDTEYCSARQGIQASLKAHGFALDTQHGGELPQALPMDVLGMPFEDFEHNRGSPQIATVWELHPAIVTLH